MRDYNSLLSYVQLLKLVQTSSSDASGSSPTSASSSSVASSAASSAGSAFGAAGRAGDYASALASRISSPGLVSDLTQVLRFVVLRHTSNVVSQYGVRNRNLLCTALSLADW